MDDDPVDDDATLIYAALNGYANWIETGDFLLSVRDAAERKKKFNALDSSQMRLVLRLRELSTEFFRHAGSSVETKQEPRRGR